MIDASPLSGAKISFAHAQAWRDGIRALNHAKFRISMHLLVVHGEHLLSHEHSLKPFPKIFNMFRPAAPRI